MTASTPVVNVDEPGDGVAVPRQRDSDLTRQALLQAARRRFAMDGYSATTVRDIAADAGVNVALINRYFASKEGLFEACLTRAAAQLEQPTSPTIERIAAGIVRGMAASQGDEGSLQLLLLLRRSGDERADAIRRETLLSYAQSIATAVDGDPAASANADTALLRAQVVIATALGVTLLRSSFGLEPLASASADDLAGPIGDVVTALLAT